MNGKTLKEGEKIPTLAGQAWQKLSDSAKKPYLDKVAVDKARYDKEMEQYKKEVSAHFFQKVPV